MKKVAITEHEHPPNSTWVWGLWATDFNRGKAFFLCFWDEDDRCWYIPTNRSDNSKAIMSREENPPIMWMGV